MRELLFRGKRTDDGAWVFGSYVVATHKYSRDQKSAPHKSWIITRAHGNGGWFTAVQRFPVIDETVSQFTGMLDRDGRRIFEGDIVMNHLDPKEPDEETLGVILWDEKRDGWGYREYRDIFQDGLDDVSGIDGKWKVVDNIYENDEWYEKVMRPKAE